MGHIGTRFGPALDPPYFNGARLDPPRTPFQSRLIFVRHAYTRIGPASDLPRTRLSFRGIRSDPFQTRLSLVGPACACFGSTFHSIRLQLQRGSRKKRYMHRTHARARVRARAHACTHGGTQALKHAGTQVRRHADAQACRHANTRACTHARLLHECTQTGAHTQAHTHTHARPTATAHACMRLARNDLVKFNWNCAGQPGSSWCLTALLPATLALSVQRLIALAHDACQGRLSGAMAASAARPSCSQGPVAGGGAA